MSKPAASLRAFPWFRDRGGGTLVENAEMVFLIDRDDPHARQPARTRGAAVCEQKLVAPISAGSAQVVTARRFGMVMPWASLA